MNEGIGWGVFDLREHAEPRDEVHVAPATEADGLVALGHELTRTCHCRPGTSWPAGPLGTVLVSHVQRTLAGSTVGPA